MQYNQNNQLTKYTDGEGVVTDYTYDIKGNLLSTINPNLKESNGKLYDNYGNVLESSPKLSSTHNLVENGSFENVGANGYPAEWSRIGSGATITTESLVTEGFNLHGKRALKISNNTKVYDGVYQNVEFRGAENGMCLTVRADVFMVDVKDASIKMYYGVDEEDKVYSDVANLSGNGAYQVIFTSQIANYEDIYGHYTECDDDCGINIFLELKDTGTIWLDDIQVEIGNPDIFTTSLFNSVENGGFENGLSYWNSTGATPIVNDAEPFGGKYRASLSRTTSGEARCTCSPW